MVDECIRTVGKTVGPKMTMVPDEVILFPPQALPCQAPLFIVGQRWSNIIKGEVTETTPPHTPRKRAGSWP